ncbi:JmjC domain-containing histone demethylation protein 1 [Eumeta japonica]|uniref:JmjC domain-containing histone demethylation protein 1 n=1 Tax=Eumeta variegata TaxID=151549 RepID=A0A4C1T7M1_EUMVA|nr:JmjC domain-containing histone demethylation protein 1 [Eumeta japonica]
MLKEITNLLGNMMYPKYGIILKGSKVFWLIPPTEKNLQLYEKWVLSGKQADVFFGDTVDKCARVYLTAGNTFFIPTGWIHAVYTPTDSLVFGGNFLHSFGIVKQLKTAQVEDATKVPQKFRYPFFTEMLWYVLARYVYVLLGHSHLEGEPSIDESEMSCKPHIHLTHYELFGLKEIVMYLYDLPPNKKNVPELVHDPVALIKDVRTLVERHCKDKPEMAITGNSVLKPPGLMHPVYQEYDRSRVKQEIKQEIARKNAEIIREQQQMNREQQQQQSADSIYTTPTTHLAFSGTTTVTTDNGINNKEPSEKWQHTAVSAKATATTTTADLVSPT